jgi:lysine-N-methylase
MNASKVLDPSYFDAFRCIGSQCEDTCCVGWIVHVDKSTYTRYHNCSDPELGPSLHTLIKIHEKSSSEDDYASIVLNGAACPFLSDGLCSIQNRLGEEYLSNMCAIYPRVMNRVDQVLQRSLDLSCPEAARIILLNPAPVEFREEHYRDGSIRSGAYPTLDVSSLNKSSEPYNLFRTVRRLVMSILQDRSHPTWKRLLILGCLCEKLGESVEAGHDTLADLLAKSPANPTVQLETVLELILARIGSDSSSRRFLECYQELITCIGLTANSTMEEIGARYAKAHAQAYYPFMVRHEYILEHYLVNYAHRTLFPFGIPESNQRLRNPRVSSPIAAQYMLMVAYYAITQTLLIGMAGFHKSAFGVDHVIKLIQSASKTFEHSATYPGRVIEMLADKSMTTPASLCVLIRN